MKKYICFALLISMLVLSFAGCSSKKSKAPEGKLSDIVEQIYKEKNPILRLETQELDLTNADLLKYNTGLNSASKVKEAVVSENMMRGGAAYSMVLLRVNDSKDTESAAKEMFEGINMAKWICVGADELRVATSGDTIMLVMMQNTLSDTITCKDIEDEFKKLCGGELDKTYEKILDNSTGGDGIGRK
jgi:hypothetical protein